MQIPFGMSDWEMPSVNVSRIRLRNMYLIDNPFSPDGVARVTRPTLTEYLQVSEDAVKGMWRQDGCLDGAWLVCTGETLHKIQDGILFTVGALPGTGFCSFASSIDRTVVVRDGVAYLTDGETIEAIEMPEEGQEVGAVACIDSVFLLTVKDTYRFYWMNPDEDAPDPLNFASAERFPDPIISIGVVSDEIWFLGSDSVEVWQPTGDIDAPYVRVNGRSFVYGCVNNFATVVLVRDGYPALIWTTKKGEVVLAVGTPQKISNASVEERLRNATNIRAWGFRTFKNDFYVLSSDQITLVYDITKQTWSVWDSYLKDVWRAHLGFEDGEDVYAGDLETGTIWRLTEEDADEGNTPLIREASGFVSMTSNQEPCYNVNLRVNSGWSTSYTDSAVIDLRWSDDLGFTWSEYVQLPLGVKGAYGTDVTFRSLGTMNRPGREFEIRYSQPTKFRLDYATMNET